MSASGDKNASLIYDPLGRLFQIPSQTIPASQFLYDADGLVAEYNDFGLVCAAGCEPKPLRPYCS